MWRMRHELPWPLVSRTKTPGAQPRSNQRTEPRGPDWNRCGSDLKWECLNCTIGVCNGDYGENGAGNPTEFHVANLLSRPIYSTHTV